MKEQIKEIAKVLCKHYNTAECKGCNQFGKCMVRLDAECIYEAGYRKQSEDLVDIATVKKWLYQIAINNVGCVIEGDFSNACEEIISRLDGLKRFAEETKGADT